MLHMQTQLLRELGNLAHMPVDELAALYEMAEQLAGLGIFGAAGPAELLDLADIVEKRAKDEQVLIQGRPVVILVVDAEEFHDPADAEHMLEQTARIGMVHRF